MPHPRMEILARDPWIEQFAAAVRTFDPTLDAHAVRTLAGECYRDSLLLPPGDIVQTLISLPNDMLRSMVGDIAEIERQHGHGGTLGTAGG